jgi:hypothetical protein
VDINIIVLNSKMSKKYVPSFLKEGALKDGTLRDGALKDVIDPPTRNFSQQDRSNSNAFSKVSHDYRKEKPVTVEVPKLAPATLASITSLSPLSGEISKGTGSFASKFAEQVRISEDPNYQKPVDLSSADDFPALGAIKKNNVVIPLFKPQPMERRQPTEKPKLTELTELKSGSAPSFAEMASLWAKKKEDDDREKAEFQRRKELEEEKMRQAARLMKKVPVLGSIGRRGISREDGSEEEEENAYVNPDEQASLGGGSNYEYEEEESFDDEDDEFGDGDGGHEDGEEEEYNPNAGWDGRRKEDLY